jgi:ferredoxin
MPRKLEIVVDPSVCVGNGMCRDEAPGSFERLADDRSAGVPNPSDSEETILEAAAICPVGAITVRDADTGETLYP